MHVREETPEGDETCRAVPVEEEIQTLAKEIALPRSARARPVYFFPARSSKAYAKIILGALYGERPEPPAVVYLRRENMGEWVVVKEAVLSVVETVYSPLLGNHFRAFID